jgi:hypothetical protein
MEDNLKLSKVEYLRTQFLDHTQNLNLSIDDQTKCLQILKIKTTSNGRTPQVQFLSVALLNPACFVLLLIRNQFWYCQYQL